MSKRSIARMVAGALLATLPACSDRLIVPNFQNPTVASVAADPLAAVPLMATGVLRDDRGNLPAYVLDVGILGREAYNYTPTEGGNTSGWLTSDVNLNTSFGALALWTGPYAAVRDAYNTLHVIDAAGAVFTALQRNAMKGLLHTEIALSLLYALNTHHTVGITVDVYDDPTKLSPFVSRDSAFTYIVALLNAAQAELAAGGTSFPFTLPSGFAGFTTPATFAKFNRALAARVNAYRASLGASGCGAARSAVCYQQVLAALQSSFLDPAGSLATGVFNMYSAASGDVANSLSNRRARTSWRTRKRTAESKDRPMGRATTGSPPR
jgi:starch-binding outer membrane protein, SusD/RagB family